MDREALWSIVPGVAKSIYTHTHIHTHTHTHPHTPTHTHTHTHTMGYYSAINKNEKVPFAATWMQLEIIILSKVSQKEKDRYCMISFIYGI